MTTGKRLAWKKNRRFGEVFGGRARQRCADGIFRRLHSIPRVAARREPVVIEDNPSRDHWFPLRAAECVAALRRLPAEGFEGLTHLWLRRPAASARRRGGPLGAFVCGSGVRAIVLYPWRTDGRWFLGRTKPSAALLREVRRFGGVVEAERDGFVATLSEEGMRRYALHVLLHEVGHHVDEQRRRWSKTNRKQAEDAAEQYAIAFGAFGAPRLEVE